MIDDPRGLERVINHDSRLNPCKDFDGCESAIADAYIAGRICIRDDARNNNEGHPLVAHSVKQGR